MVSYVLNWAQFIVMQSCISILYKLRFEENLIHVSTYELKGRMVETYCIFSLVIVSSCQYYVIAVKCMQKNGDQMLNQITTHGMAILLWYIYGHIQWQEYLFWFLMSRYRRSVKAANLITGNCCRKVVCWIEYNFNLATLLGRMFTYQTKKIPILFLVFK